MSIVFLVGGLAAIIFGANWLVGGASALAKRFNVLDMVIGLTIVSIGTSTPELAVSVMSALEGTTGIAVGNALGSNIANILLILGASAIIYPLTVNNNTQYKEIPLVILATLILGFAGNDIFFDNAASNMISRTDGMVMLGFFAIFMYYTFQIAKTDDGAAAEQLQKMSIGKSVLLIIVGVAALFLGGKYFVEGAIVVAKYFGMSESLIGLTIVAFGTSLPELATSIVAATKKNVDIAVGNIVGSNIFNIFFILGVTAVIKPLPLAPGSNIDIAVALGAAMLLFMSTFVLHKKVVNRTEGGIFVVSYLAYITFLILNQ